MKNFFSKMPFLAIVIAVTAIFVTTLAGCDTPLGGDPNENNEPVLIDWKGKTAAGEGGLSPVCPC